MKVLSGCDFIAGLKYRSVSLKEYCKVKQLHQWMAINQYVVLASSIQNYPEHNRAIIKWESGKKQILNDFNLI